MREYARLYDYAGWCGATRCSRPRRYRGHRGVQRSVRPRAHAAAPRVAPAARAIAARRHADAAQSAGGQSGRRRILFDDRRADPRLHRAAATPPARIPSIGARRESYRHRRFVVGAACGPGDFTSITCIPQGWLSSAYYVELPRAAAADRARAGSSSGSRECASTVARRSTSSSPRAGCWCCSRLISGTAPCHFTKAAPTDGRLRCDSRLTTCAVAGSACRRLGVAAELVEIFEIRRCCLSAAWPDARPAARASTRIPGSRARRGKS